MEIQLSLTSIANGGVSPSPSPCPLAKNLHINHDDEPTEPAAISSKCCDQTINPTSKQSYKDLREKEQKIIKVCE